MRRTLVLSLVVVVLATPSRGISQSVTSFTDLPLRVNRGDQVRVLDQSGARTTGRVVSFGRDGLTLATDGGERRFAGESVRRVDRRGPSKAKGAIYGIGVVAIIQLAAFPKDCPGSCPLVVGVFSGPTLGSLVGAWVPSMHLVYRAPALRAPGSARAARAGNASLLDDLGMHVNLGDHLSVQSTSGVTTAGSLKSLADDSFSIDSAQFTRETVRRVSLRRRHTRVGALLGFVAGAAWGMASADSSDHGEQFLGFYLGGVPVAGLGALVGRLFVTSTVVYPEKEARVSVSPVISRGGAGVRATLRF